MIMGLYEGLKDVAKVIQQADNIEIYRQLIDLCAQALEMQNEITRLTNENAELKRARDIEERIIRNRELFITLEDDEADTIYCSHCWDYDRKLVQVKLYPTSGKFKCVHCTNHGVFDEEKSKIYDQNRVVAVTPQRKKDFW